MRNRTRIRALFVTCALCVCGITRGQGEDSRGGIDPYRHFPEDAWLFGDVDFGRLRSSFAESPFGRMLNHPGVLKAAGRMPSILRGMIDSMEPHLERNIGLSVSGFLNLFQGRTSISIHGFDNRIGPQIVFATKARPQDRETVARLGGMIASEIARDVTPTTVKIRGSEFEQYAATRRSQQLSHGFVRGTYLWVHGAITKDILDRVNRRSDSGALSSNKVLSRIRSRAATPPIVTAFVNLQDLRSLFLRLSGSNPGALSNSVFEATGFDGVVGATFELGFESGDWTSQTSLALDGPAKGFLGAIVESVDGAEDLSGFGKIPKSASTLGAFSLHTGRIARGANELFRQLSEVPDLEFNMAMIQEVESFLGLSLRADLSVLPRINVWTAQVPQPAGGLLPDRLMLLKLSEVTPYLAILDKSLAHFDIELEGLEIADRPSARLDLARLLQQGTRGSPWRMSVVESSIIGATMGSLSFVLTPVDDEWLLISDSAQASKRYFQFFEEGASAASDSDRMDWIRETVRAENAFEVLHSGKSFIATYNSMVSLLQRAAPVWASEFEESGFEPAHLPPGEEFAKWMQPGYIAFEKKSGRLRVRSQSFLSNLVGGPLSALAVPAASLGVATFAVDRRTERDSLLDNREAGKATIETLYGSLVAFTQQPGVRAFPQGATSLEAFQKLLDSGVLRDTSVLVRPGSKEVPAARRPGKVTLTARNLSYEIVPWKQGPSDASSRILAYERRAYTGGGRWVVFVRGKTEFLSEFKFKRLLAEQKSRYGATGKK